MNARTSAIRLACKVGAISFALSFAVAFTAAFVLTLLVAS